MAVPLPEPAPNSWEELLRKMLPEGAPMPDEDQLDYSISVDYVGPTPFFRPPTTPMMPKTKFTSFPKRAPSLTPRNPSRLKSHSTSDTSDSDTKWLSASVDFTDANYSDGVGELQPANFGDHCDPDNSDEKKLGNYCGFRNRGSISYRRCSRCRKRSNGLLKLRERCIVCGAEYCKKCVLKAMGSMPEGRKCVECIRKPIDEANRGRLGKGSRLLSRLCSRSEVRRIMQVERECKANRVRAEQVIVNGREVKEKELDELLGCSAPPRDLKPGRYWYDKDSGLWGKEGAKPDRIISSKLDVGGKLQTDASNGHTKVYMNGREVTKVELRMLKLAKVQCTRNTHFWLYDDGSYEEEGQNNIKGYIWEKASIRFICSLFSLAVPPERAHRTTEESASFSARLFPEHLEQHRVQKLLLLGLEGSGTSTIFKQAKLIYTNKFTPEDLQNIKLIIQSNLYRYLRTLLKWREHFEEEALTKEDSTDLAACRSVPGETGCNESRQCIYSANQKIDNISDLVAADHLNTMFPAAAHIIDEIWKDPAIQETYKRREELRLPNVAKYFLDRAIEISSSEYTPTEKDILFAEGITPTNGLACIEFSFDDHSAVSQIYNHSQQLPTKYQLILLSSPRPSNSSKWLDMFQGMDAIIFSVSLSDYNELWTRQQNKMVASRDLFERVARHFCVEETSFLLLLTKYDVFEDKIQHVPLTVCEWFSDFNPLKIRLPLAHQAFHHIALKFKKLYACITGRKLYVRQVIEHERESVDESFRYVREIVDWKDEGFTAMSDEDSVSGAGTSE